MNALKITFLLLAVAGIAILNSGCGMSDYRTDWAQVRCQRVMAQARLSAVHELMAAGHTDHAQKVLQQYLLPEAAEQMTPQQMLAAEDEDSREDTSSQYVKVTFENELELETQAW